MVSKSFRAGAGRLQNSLSSRWGQFRQLSMISRPYGARMVEPRRTKPALSLGTNQKRFPAGPEVISSFSGSTVVVVSILPPSITSGSKPRETAEGRVLVVDPPGNGPPATSIARALADKGI